MLARLWRVGRSSFNLFLERINPPEAEKILKSLGLSISTSFELFYRQVIAQRGLPFELHVPNEKTMKAIENSRQGKGKAFSTPQEFFDDLGI